MIETRLAEIESRHQPGNYTLADTSDDDARKLIKALRLAIEQRDKYIFDEYPESYAQKNIDQDNKEIEECLK